MENNKQISFEKIQIGCRIDQFLSDQLQDVSRSYIQKLCKEGNVLVNEKTCKPNYKLKESDQVVLQMPELKELEVVAENIPLDIIYEDEDLLIVNKPKGMVVHPSAGHPNGTLVNALLYHCKDDLSGINGVLRPGIVHRIDMDTTGLLMVCKNDKAHNSIAAQLKEHSIHRVYEAIVYGSIKEDGIVDAPIGRHKIDRKKMAINRTNGKRAVTHYYVIDDYKAYSHIRCKLETGRTHQIRVHMASIGHPLLGDCVYGPQKQEYKNLQGQCLHAGVIGFVHPTTGEYMEFSVPVPDYFSNLLEKIEKKYYN